MDAALTVPFNQTRMELKQGMTEDEARKQLTFNQTRMELKPMSQVRHFPNLGTFNQTRMELKPDCFDFNFLVNQVF